MTLTTTGRRGRRGWLVPAAVILVTVALVIALGGVLQASQRNSQRQLAERFQSRGQMATSFAATWVAQLMAQQRRVAADQLSGTTNLEDNFDSAVKVFDFPAAVLLDSNGRALAIHPRAPGLMGTDLASRYQHLATAVGGQSAVSSVVASASRGVPVVAFAVPYDTPDGRRVFSGTYELTRTPLGAYLKSVIPIPESVVSVVDHEDTIVGSSVVGPVSGLPSALAAAHRKAGVGDYTDPAKRKHFFTSTPIKGTPWSLILTVPDDTLFAPIRGPERTLPWLVLVVVALLAAGANAMFLRLLRGRDRLDKSARTDLLTGLPNRRHLDEALTAALSAGERHALPVSVLVIDLDHFKRVNDSYGHTTGDRVLKHVAAVLAATGRTEDMIGRWGGEEFLALLPHTDEPGAARVAERLRQVISDTPYTNPAGDRIITTTLSIGCATSLSGGNKDHLIHRADQALYRAKSAGRDSVQTAPSLHQVS